MCGRNFFTTVAQRLDFSSVPSIPISRARCFKNSHDPSIISGVFWRPLKLQIAGGKLHDKKKILQVHCGGIFHVVNCSLFAVRWWQQVISCHNQGCFFVLLKIRLKAVCYSQLYAPDPIFLRCLLVRCITSFYCHFIRLLALSYGVSLQTKPTFNLANVAYLANLQVLVTALFMSSWFGNTKKGRRSETWTHVRLA